MKIELRKLRNLPEADQVPDLDYLKDSIKNLGLRSPILIDNDCNIIDGKRRAAAVAALQRVDIDAIIVKG